MKIARTRRWLLGAAAGVVALCALTAGVLHLPFAQTRVLSWAVSRLRDEGIRLEVRRLDYNLLALTTGLYGVRLTAAGADTPFLEAEAIQLSLPWEALTGALHIRSVEIVRPRLTLVRGTDGAWNLPASFTATSDGPGFAGPIYIDRLRIADLDVRYADALGARSAEARGISLDMRAAPGGPLTGPLSMARGATVTLRNRATDVATLDGRLSFDGRALYADELIVAAPEIRARVDGAVDLLADEPRINLRYSARLDAERIAPWIGLTPTPTGHLTATGTVAGLRDAPDLTMAAATERLVWNGAVSATARVRIDGDGSSEAEASWRDLDVGRLADAAADLPVRLAALADGRVALSWTGADLMGGRGQMSASLRPNVARAGTLPLSGPLTLTIDNRQWTLAGNQQVANAIVVTANANGRIADDLAASTLGGQATIDITDLGATLQGLERAGLVPHIKEAAQADGTATATLTLSGTLTAPRAKGSLNASGLQVAGTGPATASARVDATPRRMTVEALRIDLGPNVVTAHAEVGFAANTISGVLNADLAQLADLSASLPPAWQPAGSAQVSATFGGPLNRPTVEANVTSSDLRIAGQTVRTLQLAVAGAIDTPDATGVVEMDHLDYGQYRLGPARARVEMTNGVARFQADVPSIGGTIVATIATATGTLSATASIAGASLAALAQSSGPAGVPVSAPPVQVTGTLTANATADGPIDDLAAMTMGLDARVTGAALNGVPLRLERAARLRYVDKHIVVDDFELRTGSTTMTARGQLGSPAPAAENDALAVDLIGSLADLMPFARLIPGMTEPRTLDAAGAFDVRLRATGPIDAPDVTGRLTLSDVALTTGDLPPVSQGALAATFANGVLDVTAISGRWQGAELSGSGRAPALLLGDILPAAFRASLPVSPGPARATLRLTGITSDALAPFVDPDTLDQIGGRVDLVADIEAATLDLDGLRADVTLERAEVTLASVPMAQTQPTRFRIANRRLDVTAWSWAGAGNRLDATGSVSFTDDAQPLDLGLSGSLDLRMVGAFVPGVATSGRAMLDVRVLGTAADPSVEGRVSVDSADIVMRDPRLAITELRGVATLTKNQVRFQDVTANANGGTVALSGGLDYRGLAIQSSTLAINGRGLAMELIEGLRTEVDADLSLAVTGDQPSLGGRITIQRGDYRRPLRLTEQLFKPRVDASAPPASVASGALDRIELNIAIVSAENIVVDNNYGRLELGSNLRVAGTAAQPVVTGRLTVVEGGRAFLGGQTYTLRRGTVDFTNPMRIEPIIDLALETRVQRYDITLEVSGTPDTLEVSLRSPGLSEQDVVSLLLTGQLAGQSAMDHTEIARGQLLMLLSGELLGIAGRAVGLDSVQVGRGLGGAASTFALLATDSDPNARLTIGKNLSRNVELIFSQSLHKSGDTAWIATYRPIRQVEFRASTDPAQRSYEFRREMLFGGGPPSTTAGAGTRDEPAARVAAVQVHGAFGFPEAEIRRQLHLRAGDRFDYYRWQQDRDRLAKFFHDRDYLEARVAARRTDADGTTLEYEITRGPRTTLTVDGFALPASAIARMKTAWGRAVFDGFLIEDLVEIARRIPVADGYVQADVRATVSADTDAGKTIRVVIAAGPKFDDRGVVFHGNEQVSTSALDAVLRERGLEIEAWLDPQAIADAIAEYYRSLGYMAATAVPEAPVFSGASATLPVRVAEGRPFRIGAINVAGVAARSTDEVRQTLELEAESLYRPEAIEPARRRVENRYLREGYNQARVSATVVIARDDARADVVLTVIEGRQETLAAVEVSGAAVTSRGTVDRALDLETGKPIDLSDYYAAQKRLYDTGVFQSVDISVKPIVDDAGAGGESPRVQPMRASVVLEELPRYRFRYGFRVVDVVAPAEAVRQVRPALVADLLNRNVFGRAVTAGVASQVEFDRQLARGILSLPTVFGLPVVTNFFLTQSREDFAPEGETAFAEHGTDFSVEQRFRPARTMTVTYGYSFARKHLFELDPDLDSPLPPLDLRTRVARLTGTYSWDTRDDAANASRGWFHSSGFEFGPEALGSDLRFVRYLAQQYYFRPVSKRVVLASAFRLGAARGFGQDLLPSEKFFAGGGTTVRGFTEQGLGGEDFFGDPNGGNGMIVVNQEVRFPIYKWLRGVGFLDAGNVFDTARDISFTKLSAGTGVGVRINSPFAVIRIDYGLPLTGRLQQSSGRWYLAIGQTF